MTQLAFKLAIPSLLPEPLEVQNTTTLSSPDAREQRTWILLSVRIPEGGQVGAAVGRGGRGLNIPLFSPS